MQKRLFFLVTAVLMSISSVFAQVTTSSMSGKVTIGSAAGEEVIGATVQAVHEPSGTRYAAVTNVDGRFAINGMRTGGPYVVTVSYIGFQTKTLRGITLQLAENYDLQVWLSEDANELAEVVITGSASKFAGEKTGATTNINNAQIVNLPTVNRNITEVTRLSPYGGNGMSFAGSDGRMANFTVDGADFNNNFGLSDGLPGGGNPISIDAIEEMQVVISPFDVRQTNFIGGGVNAITKSGTNTFKGSAYVYHKNENMQGDAIDREQIPGAREKSQQTTYGFTLGGPIIKNKLFFFLNGEMIKNPTVVNRWRASENGVPDADQYLSRTTTGDMQTVSEYVKNKYGYDTGSFTSFPANIENYKFLARLDWNITDDHHLALRYNYTKNTDWRSTNASSMDGGVRSAYARFSQYSMAFANSMYSMDNIVKSFSADLNSRFTDNLSNQLLFTYSQHNDIRGTNSDEFPFIDILGGDGQNYMALGYELFTYNNGVHNTVWNIKDDVTYYAGSHKIMAGVSYEHQMADNAYMRNGTGYYRYSNLNDFLSGAIPEVVAITYGYDGETDPAARVTFGKLGVYAQDDWNITRNFKVNYGVRFDGLFFDNKDLMTNNAIYKFDYNGNHIDTGKWPSNTFSVSPRVGFTWDVFGDRSLKVRGGTGFFEGRIPLVFFTNMPTNSNMVQYKGIWNATGKNQGQKADMSLFAGDIKNKNELINFVTNTINPLTGKPLGPSTITPKDGEAGSTINGVDESFKMPQVWKTSLAIDYQLPVSFPFSITLEGIFNKKINDVCISDWSIKDVSGFARLNGVDNRAIYQDFRFLDADGKVLPNAFVLSNTSKGYGWTANVTVNAQPTEWLNLMAAYTHTVSKELTGMPGSDASSAFTYIPTIEGPNFGRLHNSQYVTPDRVVAGATVHDKSGNHFSLIYETWRGGYNYSYMTANDMNGDGYNYDLIYIPTDEDISTNRFRFVSTDDRDRFMDFVHQDSYMKNRQGEYAEAYSVYSPWVHRVDFSYKHDFKVNIGKTKHTLQLSADIKNLLNLFNSSWGVSKYLNPEIGTDARLLKYEGVDADGIAVFSTNPAISGNTTTWTHNHGIGQCWYASIGIKYIFN